MRKKITSVSVNHKRHISRNARIILLFLFVFWLYPLPAHADIDPGDDYWLKQYRVHPIGIATYPSVSNEVTTKTPIIHYTTIPTESPLPVAAISGYPSWIPRLSPSAKALLLRGTAIGHDRRLFTIAGDSNSNPIRYLGRVSSGAFPLSKYPELQSIVQSYAPSFSHISIAVGGGFRAADMFDTVHVSEFDACRKDEGMFSCELRASNAGIVFIELGTGDKFVWRDFENNYRAMLDYAIHSNVLPILVTKADEIESLQGGANYGYINGVIRALAAEYQMPLLDMYAATRDLPIIPNPALPKRPFTQFGLQDEWGYYFHLNDIGQDRHILITLQTLAAIGA